MNFLCFLFGCKWRFAYKLGEDGVLRTGWRQIDVMCQRCGAVAETQMGWVDEDGEIYDEPPGKESGT